MRCEDLKKLCDESYSIVLAGDDVFYCDSNGKGDWLFHYCPLCGTKQKPDKVETYSPER